jgi:hypothetical protein
MGQMSCIAANAVKKFQFSSQKMVVTGLLYETRRPLTDGVGHALSG